MKEFVKLAAICTGIVIAVVGIAAISGALIGVPAYFATIHFGYVAGVAIATGIFIVVAGIYIAAIVKWLMWL